MSEASQRLAAAHPSLPAPPDPLPHPVADSHCHLDITRSDAEVLPVDTALDLAGVVGVTRIVQIGCDLPGARWAVEAAESDRRVVAGVALHPNEVPELAERGELDAALAEIERLAMSSSRVRAIGETGLDHFRTGEAGWRVQEEAFAAHIDLAGRLDRTLVIHDRDAHADVLRVLTGHGAPDRVVMHCFSGDAEFAAECVRRGYFVSFAGTVTFKNAESLRAAARVVPLEQLLVETDAPYLAPMPHRGRTNASYLIPLVVRCIAEVKGIDVLRVCEQIDATTTEVFGHWD